MRRGRTWSILLCSATARILTPLASATSSMCDLNGGEARTGSRSCWIGAQKAVTAQIAPSLTPSACKLHHQSGRSCGYAGHSIDIDCMWPAILWQMEPRIAADQGNVASAGAVNIARFATGHEGVLGATTSGV